MKKFVIFLIMIFSLQTFAQKELGLISGEVSDPYGAVIPNANVKVFPIINGKIIEENEFSTITNNKGEFIFQNVPIGLYEVQIKVSWTEIVVKKRISVRSNKSAENNLVTLKYSIEACSDVIETKDLTSETDKAEIIKEILKNLVTKDKSKLIISTQNIKAEWLEERDKEQIKLMTQLEIFRHADEKGDFDYYQFSVFKVKGTCVEISLNYDSTVEKTLGGSGNTYEFRKIDGKWVKKFVIGWVS